jgi:hypothetical protein
MSENGKQAEGIALSASKGVVPNRRNELWQMGKRAFQYTSFNLALTLALGWAAWLPRWIFIPYFLQWLETIWGITHPAIGWKPTSIGLRQLGVSTLFTLLFILCWRL